MRVAVAASLLFSLVFAFGCAHRQVLPVDSPYRPVGSLAKGEILHAATGRLLTEAEVLDYVTGFPVVFVGETHDNVDDHAVELSVLKALSEKYPGKVALGMEMLRRPSQEKVNAYLAGQLDERGFWKVWQENWGNFAYYAELLRYAKEHSIPVLALNADNETKKAVLKHGFQEADPEVAKRLPEIDADDPYYREFVMAMFGGHAAGAKESEAFYRVQVLWDETMAQTAGDYLKGAEGQGRHLLVIAGGNHVRYGFGIPRRLFRRVPVPYVILEPVTAAEVEVPEEKQMEVDVPVMPMRGADLYWAVGYEDLEGQRVMLGVEIAATEGKGVRVAGVMPESPAQKAGVLAEDVIVAVDGRETLEPSDVSYYVSLHKVGDKGSVEVVRKGEKVVLPVVFDVVKHGQ